MRRYAIKLRVHSFLDSIVRERELYENVMHRPGNGTMVDGTVGGIFGPFHDTVPRETLAARRRKWEQRGPHGSGSVAC
ncbi:hypothetical protein KM043_003055 [Ampulex compressa]|nr:hypothetical protein KM043_003055 [Ampulex compressa]